MAPKTIIWAILFLAVYDSVVVEGQESTTAARNDANNPTTRGPGVLDDGESRVATLAPEVTTTTAQTDPCDSNPCQHGGECFSNDAGYRCFCPEDWHGDNCEKRKPCVVNPCQNDGICEENGEDFACTCPEGWKGETCEIEVVDPCQPNPCKRGICSPDRVNPETFSCSCPSGWTGRTCNADIDECRNNPCGGGKNKCYNRPGTFICVCATGYESKGTTCVDINECRGIHDCDHTCKNTKGGYRCECRAGFTLDRNKKTCTDIDECDDWTWNKGPCEYDCENTAGSYKCSCREGYEVDKDGHSCVDVNECGSSNGGCEHYCQNDRGSYNCYCRRGYNLAANRKKCREITCPRGDVFEPTHGRFEMTNGNRYESRLTYICDQGYQNTGTEQLVCGDDGKWQAREGGHVTPPRCVDIDECADDSTNECEHSCVNVESSFYCTCPEGYRIDLMDGKSCRPINCTGLYHPTHGRVAAVGSDTDCTTRDVVKGTKCRYTCEDGYEPVEPTARRVVEGDIVRECGTTGSWSEKRIECSPMECPLLTMPDHAQVYPMSCREQARFGKRCTVSCGTNYRLKGEAVTTCTNVGSAGDVIIDWSPKDWTCVEDFPEPYVICPDDVNVQLGPGKSHVVVNLTSPQSNYETTIDGDYVLGENNFTIGQTKVVYTAHGHNDETASCTLRVRVLDILDLEEVEGEDDHEDHKIVRLTIAEMRAEDEGLYKCVATNIAGSHDRKVTISIAEDYQDFGSRFGPTFHQPRRALLIAFLDKPSNATVLFGESHIFLCSAEGAVDISWTKDDQPNDTIIDGDRVLQHRGDLVFTAVSLTDSGRYTCTARSGEGDRSIQAHAVLNVDIDVNNVCDMDLIPVCGRPFHAHGPDGFVVGGTEADRGAFPWQAMLWDIRPARNSSHMVEEIIVHPNFNGETYESDIALLKLSGPEVTFTEHILPICLPEVLDARRLVRSGQIGTVTGWGAMEDGGPYSTTLMRVSLPVVSLQRCRRAHPQFAEDISQNMFCAGRASGGRDTCKGDSGGPFASYDNGRWVLLGIVSWGDGCVLQGKYGVYTRVHRFREWIVTHIENPDIPVQSAGGLEDGESRVTTLAPEVNTTTAQTDPCDSNPCQHGGECFSNDAGYRCFCPGDWHGDNCEKRKPCFVNPCQNDGICEENGDDYTCSCPEGWKGETCEIEITCPRGDVFYPTRGRFEMTNGNRYESRLTYICDQGYQNTGTEQLVCGDDGKWQAREGGHVTPPRCVETCGLSTFNYHPGSDCLGSDITAHFGVSLEFCADACCADPTCLSFQYNIASFCALKYKHCSEKVKSGWLFGDMYDRRVSGRYTSVKLGAGRQWEGLSGFSVCIPLKPCVLLHSRLCGNSQAPHSPRVASPGR
uniref:Uncharacterized protein n=1 Tax=Branchiostoma floridae TaxID=7739 RepID=C3XPW8_BRAFL|eukprot:XP_002613980.1 hypothetical protein BRAFLDRAFT_118458 [Branchiostoma floridae]